MSEDTAVSVSIEEAARRLGVCPNTVYSLVTDGKVRSFHVGRRHLIAVVELERFAERQTAAQNVKPVPPTRQKSAAR